MTKLTFRERLRYRTRASYRRQALDRLQEKYKHLYSGTVLDVGGRSRGIFKKPREAVEKWIFTDIVEGIGADMILDIADMKGKIEDESIDVLNCLELFEHVKKIDKALDESERVLKPGGMMMISVPFLYPVHGEPDFQRWTKDKWHYELERRGLHTEVAEINGYVFTIVGEILKIMILKIPSPLFAIKYLITPVFNAIVWLDTLNWTRNHERFKKYHAGYFFIVRKVKNTGIQNEQSS